MNYLIFALMLTAAYAFVNWLAEIVDPDAMDRISEGFAKEIEQFKDM